MTIKNLTPHAIHFIEDGSVVKTIEPEGILARVSAVTVETGEVIDGIKVTATSYGEVEGLPDPVDGTVYIVSALVAGRVPERKDVFIPNESVRDDKGRIVGCRSLGRI